MKKEELTKGYEDIKISNVEKTKIYNNIMNNRKRRSGTWIPILGFCTVAALLFIFILIGMPMDNDVRHFREPVKIASQNIMYASPAVKYKEELNDNLSYYINENDIKVENGLDINADDVVESDVCDGTLRFKVVDGLILVDTDLSCANMKENEYDVIYTIFTFEDNTIVPTKIIDDGTGYIVFSDINIKEVLNDENYYDVYNDLNFTKLDYDYNIVFSYQIDRNQYLNNFDDEERISINNYIEYNNMYYIFIEVHDFSGNVYNYIKKLDKNGEFVEEVRLMENISHLYYQKDNYIYYSSYDFNQEYNFKIVVYDLEKFEEVKILGENTSEGNIIPIAYEGEYLYALSSINYYVDWDDVDHADGIEGLYKYKINDDKIEVVKEVDFNEIFKLNYDAYYFNSIEYKSVGDYLVVSYNIDYYDEKEDYSSAYSYGIIVYDKELNYIDHIEYSVKEDGVVGDVTYYIDDLSIYVDDNKVNLLFNLSDFYIMIDTYNLDDKKVTRVIYEYSSDYYNTLYVNEVLSANPKLKYYTVRGNENYNFVSIATINEKDTE